MVRTVPRAWRSLAALLVGLVITATAAPEAAAARANVVVLPFSGPRGAQAAQLVTRALSARYRVVSRGAFVSLAQQQGANYNRPEGRAQVASALGIAALIGGAITHVGGRWVLRVTVFSGHNGAQVGSAVFPLRGTRVDPGTAQRVPSEIAPAVARARPGRGAGLASAPRIRDGEPRPARRPARVAVRRSVPAEAPEPPPPPRRAPPPRRTDNDRVQESTDEEEEGESGADREDVAPPPAAPVPKTRTTRPRPQRPATEGSEDDLGFEVDHEEKNAGSAGSDDIPRLNRPRHRLEREPDEEGVRKPPTSSMRSAWESIIELSLGIMMMTRNFSFSDPIYPQRAEDHSDYHSGVVPAIVLEGSVYPLAYFSRSFWGNLGLVSRYYRVLGLKSQKTGVEPLPTTLHDFEIGLRYRWNILNRLTSPILQAGLDYGRLSFVIWDTQTQVINLPDIIYHYLKLAVLGLEVPFYAKQDLRLRALANFDYLAIFTAGPIERTDSGGYGNSTTGGIDLDVGLLGSYRGFFLKALFSYRRIFYKFDNACYVENQGTTCWAAKSATDVYVTMSFLGGYAY